MWLHLHHLFQYSCKLLFSFFCFYFLVIKYAAQAHLFLKAYNYVFDKRLVVDYYLWHFLRSRPNGRMCPCGMNKQNNVNSYTQSSVRMLCKKKLGIVWHNSAMNLTVAYINGIKTFYCMNFILL